MDQYRPIPVRPINAGRNSALNPLLLSDGESPDLLNVDLDRGSVRSAGGSAKFNNQTAPRAGVLVGARQGRATLPVLPGKSVPIRSSIFIPYDQSQDVVGADYNADVKTGGGATAPFNRSFARQRGKSFDVQCSFRIPEDEKLYAAPTRGALNNPGASYVMKFGADEALDEFFTVGPQKGGDRMTPMSWAIGVVNTGELFDIDVGGGNNIFGLSTATHAKRRSNYALCFLWLDAPCYGVDRPVCARYRLDAGSVWFDEAGHPTSADGQYPTFAYRAMIVPFFVEPGEDIHVALRLSLDTGTAGTAFDAATGQTSGVSWNGDGWIEWKVARGYDAVETFTSANGAGSQILRYKGPTDSLEYLCKYGVRYHGRDAVHIGLGYRFSPWSSGGYIPFGIDSCPVENGGFQITDMSAHGPFGSLYEERVAPELEPGGANIAYQTHSLVLEHLTGIDATGTRFAISHTGFVGLIGIAAGQLWGNQTGVWANIDATSGKNPFFAYDLPWAGLGGLLTTGFNPEALKSYRLVFMQDSGGWSANGACGGMISIGTFDANPANWGGWTYPRGITAEGGDQFLGVNPNLPFAVNRHKVTVRAFRWNQRRVIVSDVRFYSRPRTWSVLADFSLAHELDRKRTGDPGLPDLRAHWPLHDGGGYECEETSIGNSGYFSPMAGQRASAGGIFLSGEGEALYLNLADNPDFRAQLREMQRSRFMGCAIQISMRIPEAQYAVCQRVNDEYELGASPYRRGKFAPPFAVWDIEVPDRLSDLIAPDGGSVPSTQVDHVQGMFTRPQPILEFGHNVYVEDAVGIEPFAYPMGFSLRVPRATAPFERGSDQGYVGLSVPGTGAGGLHAWFNAGTNTSRWDRFAGWAGKDIVVQFGLQPTATADKYRPYIAAWPKEFLNPQTNDPSGAEFAYFATSDQTITMRDVERSVITIGGAWNPRIDNARFTSGINSQWQTLARSAHECNMRMVVKDVRVFGSCAPGALPGTTGAVVSQGTGKIVGENALPLRALTEDDISIPVSVGGTPVNFTEGSRIVSAAGSAFLSTANPQDSKYAIVRTFLHVLGDVIRHPQENTDGVEWPRTYFITAATVSSLTLNRPVIGATRKASAAKVFRLLGYTAFEDEQFLPLTVGRGRGYDTGTVTTRDCQVSQPAFRNLSPVASPWRWRVYSSIPAGSSLSLLPRWVRGVKRSTWNTIRGLHGVNDVLYAGAHASLFEADDRWRPYGPTDALEKAIAVRSSPRSPVRRALQSDRILFQDASRLQLGGTWAVESGVGYLSVLDAWVRPDAISGIQTILWCGRLDSNPVLSAGSHGITFWTRINDGYPEIVVGSNVAGPSRGLYIARGSRRIQAGEWTHIRWGVLGVAGGTPSLDEPVLWVGGKRVPVTVNASDAGAAAGTWLAQSGVQYDANYRLVVGAARDAVSAQEVTQVFTAAVDASKAPILPALHHGWMHTFGGELSGIVCARETNGAAGFDTTRDFDPRSITYNTRRFSAIEDSLSSYGLGHKLLDTVGQQFGVIYSHPLISITHEMGGGDAQWSFADYEYDVFCANGGRVGVIDTRDNSFRFSGIQPPRAVPKATIVRTPLWKQNTFVMAGSADNDPIFNLQADKTSASAPTSTTPAVTEKVFHYRNPGTLVLQQAADAGMAWTADKFIAFKCYLRMNSVTGRINIWSRRSSLSNGTFFLEIRDGFVYAGWYDINLKKEVWVRTSIPVIEPGYVYYIYYRKWFPRGGLATAHNAQLTADTSNWANSLHCYKQSGTWDNQETYDSLIVRRFTRAAQTGYWDFTGYDAKSYLRDTNGALGGAGNFDYPGTGSSARMCVSATSADATHVTDPYTQQISPTGCVMVQQPLSAVAGTVNGTVILHATNTTQRFVLDHVGMLLEVRGGTFDRQLFRIVEFVTQDIVRVIAEDGTTPNFGGGALVGSTVMIFCGFSLIKSDDYDNSKSPDPGSYAIELFGSSLQANPLNGVSPFDGEAWSFAYVSTTGNAGDGGGNLVEFPDIFEDIHGGAGSLPSPAAPGNRIACGCEVGTDVFGLQGSGNTVTGQLPWQGNPAGELQVDDTRAHTCVDTAPYYDTTIPYTPAATVPSSTQPNSALTVAADTTSSADLSLTWIKLNPVIAGTRYARIAYYDRHRGRVSAPGDSFTVNIPGEDANNPSAAARLVLSLLPACPDGDGFSTRIYLSAAASTVPLLRAQVDDGAPDSIEIPIDEVSAVALGILDVTAIGVPPNAALVCSTQGRMCYGRLEGDDDSVMFSLPFFPENVPAANIFPANTGRTGITALADFKGALVVFKRDSIMPVKFDPSTGIPLIGQSISSDGCVSHSSIVSLEDRIYYVSDRGPQVMLEDFQPFFIGRQMQEDFKGVVDASELSRCYGAINRQRSQYVFTVKWASRGRMDRRFVIEFAHPMQGEDAERAEMTAGHRSSLHEGPACTALGSVSARGGGAKVLVGGTDQGFIVWLDMASHRTVLGGPVVNAGATPLWGSRTLVKGAAALSGTFDRALEGHMGQVLRAYLTYELEAYVLFTANDGQDRVYLESPVQEAMTWLNAAAIPTNAVISLSAALVRYSTKDFDCGTPHLRKVFYWFYISRRATSGILKLDVFGNGSAAPRATPLEVDLSEQFGEAYVQRHLQGGDLRSARFLLRTQTPAIDVDVELFDAVIAVNETDPR